MDPLPRQPRTCSPRYSQGKGPRGLAPLQQSQQGLGQVAATPFQFGPTMRAVGKREEVGLRAVGRRDEVGLRAVGSRQDVGLRAVG